MERLLRALLFLCCFHLAVFTNPEPECVIELTCAECVPEHMPLVTSHGAAAGAVRARHGDELLLACGGGKFLAYPMRETLAAVCEAGRYRVTLDNSLRPLLELGCQEDIFEDVQHSVEHCGQPLVGRSYQMREAVGGSTRHLATVCFDGDRGLAVWAVASSAPRNDLRLPPHTHRAAPLTLLGNFNHMFDARTRTDAERLYSDDARLTKRLHELFKHERFSFANQQLTPGKLLAADYFEDQNMRVTEFASNKVAVWASVAAGNLRHLQRDVARFVRQAHAHSPLLIYAGTHKVLSLRTAHERKQVFLQGGRFPVPRYIWTVVHDPAAERAMALVVLNDPLVAVSEIRDAVFCESSCSRVSWARELRRQRNYEVPLYGLVFCCSAHNFTDAVPTLPKDILKNVPAGDRGMLLDTLPNPNH